jgi:hypothetical protein
MFLVPQRITRTVRCWRFRSCCYCFQKFRHYLFHLDSFSFHSFKMFLGWLIRVNLPHLAAFCDYSSSLREAQLPFFFVQISSRRYECSLHSKCASSWLKAAVLFQGSTDCLFNPNQHLYHHFQRSHYILQIYPETLSFFLEKNLTFPYFNEFAVLLKP